MALPQKQLKDVIEQLVEQVSQHMLNMTLAPDLTVELIQSAEDRAIESIQQLAEKVK
jgi:hypothetical protein